MTKYNPRRISRLQRRSNRWRSFYRGKTPLGDKLTQAWTWFDPITPAAINHGYKLWSGKRRTAYLKSLRRGRGWQGFMKQSLTSSKRR